MTKEKKPRCEARVHPSDTWGRTHRCHNTAAESREGHGLCRLHLKKYEAFETITMIDDGGNRDSICKVLDTSEVRYYVEFGYGGLPRFSTIGGHPLTGSSCRVWAKATPNKKAVIEELARAYNSYFATMQERINSDIRTLEAAKKNAIEIIAELEKGGA